jgi:hypothetical protein
LAVNRHAVGQVMAYRRAKQRYVLFLFFYEMEMTSSKLKINH